jgi:hypothetical protein
MKKHEKIIKMLEFWIETKENYVCETCLEKITKMIKKELEEDIE